jgi:hypothetical protein
MKKRVKSWLNHLTIRYIPSIQQIAQLEAKRLVAYITENYSRDDQKYLIDEMAKNLIEFRKQEIEDKIIELEQNEAELVSLNKNLEELLVK